MRNAWAIFRDGRLIGQGDGELNLQHRDGCAVVWRDTTDEIMALPAVRYVEQQREARAQVHAVDRLDRSAVKQDKAACAQQFLDEVPEPAVVDPADPDAIPTQYVELYDEYWQTFDLTTTAVTPWDLARLIIQRAEEGRQAASLGESKLRRQKLQAKHTLTQARPPIPNE